MADDDVEGADFEDEADDAETLNDADATEPEEIADIDETDDVDEVEDSEEIEAVAVVDDDVDTEDDDADSADDVAAKKPARGEPARAETSVVHSVAAKEAARQRLASDVEAFLKRGGAIETVEQDVRADPPKKPESNYGRGSI